MLAMVVCFRSVEVEGMSVTLILRMQSRRKWHLYTMYLDKIPLFCPRSPRHNSSQLSLLGFHTPSSSQAASSSIKFNHQHLIPLKRKEKGEKNQEEKRGGGGRGGGASIDPFLRELVLLANVRMLLASADSSMALGRLADKVMEVATPTISASQTATSILVNTEIQHL